jgi:hypothetical protein
MSRTPAVEDFSEIKANLDRIRKEKTWEEPESPPEPIPEDEEKPDGD